MTSLWTPDGERRVDPRASAASTQQEGEPVEQAGLAEDFDDQEELARLEQELLDTSVAQVIANHCYGLFQLAALHLAQRPARLSEASLAIDALGAIVEGLGARLGPAGPTLAEGLSGARLAFVEIAKAQNDESQNGSTPSGGAVSTDEAAAFSPEPGTS
jgi:hypothetical protein